jgi:hypothetical protein
MSPDLPVQELRSIVTDQHYQEQSQEGIRRFYGYAFSQGLRKTMAYLDPENVQKLKASREFRTGTEDIPAVANSSASSVFDAQTTEGMLLDLDYDRAEDGDFPWSEIQSVLGLPSTVYDIPIRHLVVRFESDDFHQKWETAFEDAIDIKNFPTGWIEGPFYAELISRPPGGGDARERVRSAHDDFYYLRRSASQGGHDGLGWNPSSLDLEGVWSHRGYTSYPDAVRTTRIGDRSYDWTPRRLEQFVMNYFDEDNSYVGLMRNPDFVNDWRQIHSTDMTSTKVFEWEEGEEWVQQEDTQTPE